MIFGVTIEVKLKSKSEPMKPLSPGAFARGAAGATGGAPCHCGGGRAPLPLRRRRAGTLARLGAVARRLVALVPTLVVLALAKARVRLILPGVRLLLGAVRLA